MSPSRGSGSLLTRTSLVLCAALALAVAALVLVLQPFLATTFERETDALLTEQESRARGGARAGDGVTETLLRVGADHDFDLARAVLRDTPIELVTASPEEVRALLLARLDAAHEARRRSLGVLRPEMDERTRARLDAEWDAARELSRRRAREFSGVTAARTATGLLALVAVLFLVHGWLLWRSVLAPLRRLGRATDALARGELAARVPVTGDDEVQRLGADFNGMAESLGRQDAELRALNATLEERVRTKTLEIEAKERALRHADKMASLGTLAGGVAHEFNNLLGGIQGCAEDGTRETDPDELRATLAMIERTARRGTAITQNLLRFARPGEGARRDTDLTEVLRDVAALVASEAARTGAVVRLEGPQPVVVHADQTALHQVALNLATNALHALAAAKRSGREGPFEVVLRAEPAPPADGGPPGGRLVVEDNGTGIAPEHRDRLFEPFFTTRAEGTGLGLSVSWGIVHAHGGRIDVRSEPGRGTVFTVELPAGRDRSPS